MRSAWALFVGVAWCLAAKADWGYVGAAFRCDPARGAFVLAGTSENSDGEGVPAEEGFTQLANGRNTLTCAVGPALVSAEVFVVPPQPRGMCMGGGRVSIARLDVGTVPVFPSPEPFNSGCGSDPELMRLTIDSEGDSVRLETCHRKPPADLTTRGPVECARAPSSGRFRASFDCEKAARTSERLVCADAALGRLDHRLYRKYREALRFQASSAALRNSQRSWVARRDACGDAACVKRSYEARLAELQALIPKVDSNIPVY